MPMIATLSNRITDRYVGTCSHMDEWDHICNVKLIFAGESEDPKGYDYDRRPDRFYTFRLPPDLRDLPMSTIRWILRDSFNRQNCHHDYDCCGCASVSVRNVKRHDRRRVSFMLEIRLNY